MTDNPGDQQQVSSTEAFNSFIKNVTNALKDASELTVLTFSGTNEDLSSRALHHGWSLGGLQFDDHHPWLLRSRRGQF